MLHYQPCRLRLGKAAQAGGALRAYPGQRIPSHPSAQHLHTTKWLDRLLWTLQVVAAERLAY
jgi:hypothetical protein